MYRIFSTPRYAVRSGLYFRAIDVGMFQIHMVLLENIGIHIQENLFDGVRKFISDEDAKGGIGRCLHAIKKIQEPPFSMKAKSMTLRNFC